MNKDKISTIIMYTLYGVIAICIVGGIYFSFFQNEKTPSSNTTKNNETEKEEIKEETKENDNELTKDEPENTQQNDKIKEETSTVNVTGISIEKANYNIAVGGKIQLKTNITPENATNKNVIFKTSDSSIATVSNKGIVIGKKTGTVTITVISEDGNKLATTKVNVKKEETLTATFITNDKTKVTKAKVSCQTINGSCTITSPTPSITQSGWTVVGWNSNKNAKVSQVGVNKKITMTSNLTFYVITQKTLTANFIVNSTNTIKQTCTIYNNETSCKVTAPSYEKPGSYNNTWGESPNATAEQYLIYKEQVELKENKNYYAMYKHPFATRTNYSHNIYSHDRNLSIVKTVKVGNTTFDYETGIPANVIAKHLVFLDKAYSKIPWLFTPGKVFVMTADTYSKCSQAYGLTTFGGAYSFMDVQYDVGYGGVSENATIHEMAHAWDNHYGFKTGTRVLFQEDVTNFHNKLGKEKVQNLSRGEWIAGLITEYYWHYLGMDPSHPSYAGYKDNYTTSEKKEAVTLFEKYINISRNWVS